MSRHQSNGMHSTDCDCRLPRHVGSRRYDGTHQLLPHRRTCWRVPTGSCISGSCVHAQRLLPWCVSTRLADDYLTRTEVNELSTNGSGVNLGHMAQQTELPITRHFGTACALHGRQNATRQSRRPWIHLSGCFTWRSRHLFSSRLIVYLSTVCGISRLLRKIAFYRLLVIDVPFKLWWLGSSIDASHAMTKHRPPPAPKPARQTNRVDLNQSGQLHDDTSLFGFIPGSTWLE